MAGGGGPPEPPPPPMRPQSPFVTRLRAEIALSRQPDSNWELQPSIGSWLTPRGRHRRTPSGGQAAPRRVSFADGEAPSLPAVQPRTPVKLELRIKGTASKPFTLEAVEDTITVAELKAMCESHSSLPVDQQRLLYKGKLLQDAQLLSECNLPSKAVLFLVKGASTSSGAAEQAAREAEQRREQERQEEEARAWALGAHGPICIECGVNPGRLQTNGLCSICWREQVVRENKELKRRRDEAKKKEQEARKEAEEQRRREEELELIRQQDPSRCYQCRKKIGLTGFQCQCGYFFCAKHRYAEEHACTFDHQARGREILAQQAQSSSS